MPDFLYKYLTFKIMSKTVDYWKAKDDRNYMQVLDSRINNHECTRSEAAWNYERYSNHMYPNKYKD